MNKKCSRCKIEKSLNLFNKDKRAKDGLTSDCKSCHYEVMKKYKKAEYHRNKFRHSDRAKRYYAKNRERIKAQTKSYYDLNRDQIIPKRNEYQKKYKVLNRSRVNFWAKQRRVRMKGVNGSYTLEQWEDLKRDWDNLCLLCLKQEPEIVLTVDHVLPVSKGGSNDIWNIQPLCNSCNSRKNTKYVDFRTGYGIEGYKKAREWGVRRLEVEIYE